ncbi:MAG TPA: hypothetical protein DD730_05540 [Desulfosporosinus sp.]|nr:hypothetical protein [Desulfosporosinus sp.]
MINQKSKLSVGIAMLFVTILLVTAFLSIATRQWKNVYLSLLAMVGLSLPFIITYIANRKYLELPSSFQSITLVFVFLALYLGEIGNFYQVFWWWDLLLHAIFGSYAVIIALHSIKGIIRKEQDTTDRRFTLFALIFSFSFSIALGTLWEMCEFAADYLFKSSMVKGGLDDTYTDLLIKIAAAFITAIIYYYRNWKKAKSFS